MAPPPLGSDEVALFGRRKRVLTRLLVVEDEPLIAFATEHLLGDAGYEVVDTVDRVADAIRCVEKGTAIDLVLVDVNLADGSGIDVARAAHARGVQVMFVTGNCPGEARGFAAGCLSKPYAPRDLLGAIEAIEAVGVGPRAEAVAERVLAVRTGLTSVGEPAFQRVEDARRRHEYRHRRGGEQQLPADAGIGLQIVRAPFHRSGAEAVDDQERLELGLDDEQAGKAVEHVPRLASAGPGALSRHSRVNGRG